MTSIKDLFDLLGKSVRFKAPVLSEKMSVGILQSFSANKDQVGALIVKDGCIFIHLKVESLSDIELHD